MPTTVRCSWSYVPGSARWSAGCAAARTVCTSGTVTGGMRTRPERRSTARGSAHERADGGSLHADVVGHVPRWAADDSGAGAFRTDGGGWVPGDDVGPQASKDHQDGDHLRRPG